LKSILIFNLFILIIDLFFNIGFNSRNYRDIKGSESDSDYESDDSGPDLFEPEESLLPRRALEVTWASQNIEELRAKAYISSLRSIPEHKKDLKEIWEKYGKPHSQSGHSERGCQRRTPVGRPGPSLGGGPGPSERG
jgi:hypothetical protein